MSVNLDGLSVDPAALPMPPITRRAAEYITTTDQVADVVAAYYYPSFRTAAPDSDNVERRQNGECSLLVFRDTGVVCGVRWLTPDPIDTDPHAEPGPARQRKARGGRGNVWPTTWAELHKRLSARGCTIEHGGKHWRVTLPDGALCVLPCTASDWRSLRNAALGLRSRGVDVSA